MAFNQEKYTNEVFMEQKKLKNKQVTNMEKGQKKKKKGKKDWVGGYLWGTWWKISWWECVQRFYDDQNI